MTTYRSYRKFHLNGSHGFGIADLVVNARQYVTKIRGHKLETGWTDPGFCLPGLGTHRLFITPLTQPSC